jgi:hypothetical protein
VGWYAALLNSMQATGVQSSSHLGASVTFTMPFTFSFEEYASREYGTQEGYVQSVLLVR